MIKEQLKTIRQALVAFAERQAQLLARYSRKVQQEGSSLQRGVGSLLVSDIDSEEEHVDVVSATPSSVGGTSARTRHGRSSNDGDDGSGPRAGDSNSSHGGGDRRDERGHPEAANGAAIPAAVPVAVAWYSDGSREELGLQASCTRSINLWNSATFLSCSIVFSVQFYYEVTPYIVCI